MAHILVQTPDTVSGRHVGTLVVERLRSDGHDAGTDDGDLLARIQEADAVVAVVDGSDPLPGSAASIGCALEKPVLALVGPGGGLPFASTWLTLQEGIEPHDWFADLDDWYEKVRPFAGRMVRDLIPNLVREAGHDVTFRAATGDERPRLLKQKVLQEARDLLAAGAGAEKEEIGDLLEALEALIRVRDYDREALRRVKDAKRKQRGGFERCWVVEATSSAPAETAPAEPEPEAPATEEDAEATEAPRFFEV